MSNAGNISTKYCTVLFVSSNYLLLWQRKMVLVIFQTTCLDVLQAAVFVLCHFHLYNLLWLPQWPIMSDLSTSSETGREMRTTTSQLGRGGLACSSERQAPVFSPWLQDSENCSMHTQAERSHTAVQNMTVNGPGLVLCAASQRERDCSAKLGLE